MGRYSISTFKHFNLTQGVATETIKHLHENFMLPSPSFKIHQHDVKERNSDYNGKQKRVRSTSKDSAIEREHKLKMLRVT